MLFSFCENKVNSNVLIVKAYCVFDITSYPLFLYDADCYREHFEYEYRIYIIFALHLLHFVMRESQPLLSLTVDCSVGLSQSAW